jgi:hypothetical protein
MQQRIQVGGVERALARLVDHGLARRRLERIDDVVPVFAAHQDAAHRPGIADPVLQAAAQLLVERQVGKIRPMPLAGMDDEQALLARGIEHPARRRDCLAQQRDVVAQRFAESAGSTKSRCMSMMTSAQLARSN